MIVRELSGGVELEFPAKPEYLAEVRRTVEQLAARVPMKRDAVEDLLTAVDEAVANAIRHGSPRKDEDTVQVRCLHLPRGLRIEVQDRGKGFTIPRTPSMPGPEATGGRGLPLMCALADRVEISSEPTGALVSLEKKSRG